MSPTPFWISALAALLPCALLNAQLLSPQLRVNETVVAEQSGPIVIDVGTGTTSVATTAANDDSDGPATIRAAEGPWGELEYFAVFMEAPDHLVAKFPLSSALTRWSFNAKDEPNLQKILTGCGFTDEQATSLIKSPGRNITNGFIHLFPPPDLVFGLSEEVRSSFYRVLRTIPSNDYHVDPVLIVGSTLDEWLEGANLRPEMKETMRKLSYMRGEAIAFSDVAMLMSQASGEAEARTVLKALTRTRAQVMKLLVGKSTNIDSLLSYWSTGANLRRKDMEPMLRAVAATRGAEKLDILHILPPLARKYVMTYPDMSLGADGIFPDCHWTSLNFFNYQEQPHLLDARLATSSVLERFSRVEPPYRYGDILFFLNDENGDAFHSCVYLADNLVYTKNGRNVLSPWIISTLSDVQKVYLYDGNGKVQGFRINPTEVDQ